MAKLLWGLLCDRIIVDRETNATSHIDVIDSIIVEKFPTVLFRAALALMWKAERENEELQIRILVNWPGATEAIVVEPDKFPFEGLTHRFNLTVNNIKIEEAGELSFEVKHFVNGKWKKADRFSYPITQIKEMKSTE